MDERSDEVAMDDLSTVHPGDESSSIKKLDMGRHDNNEGDIPREERVGIESDHPPAQGRTEQTDRLAAKPTVDSRFACTECGYRAAFRSHLLIHARTHAGDKPYKCDQCDYSATQKGNLDRHMAKHTGEKPYMCGECGYRTADRSALTVHMRTHTGVKHYKCDQCDYSTAQKSSLDRHMPKHTGEKPYMCGECGYRTADRSTLTRHMRTHTEMVERSGEVAMDEQPTVHAGTRQAPSRNYTREGSRTRMGAFHARKRAE
ncbi:uncharacterized protein LOC144876976 [Branchiostoma floridae x Branchiostoma japonicum]